MDNPTYDPDWAPRRLAEVVERERMNRKQRRLFWYTRVTFCACCTLAAALVGSLLGRFVH